jgi:hypothetical protein
MQEKRRAVGQCEEQETQKCDDNDPLNNSSLEKLEVVSCMRSIAEPHA